MMWKVINKKDKINWLKNIYIFKVFWEIFPKLIQYKRPKNNLGFYKLIQSLTHMEQYFSINRVILTLISWIYVLWIDWGYYINTYSPLTSWKGQNWHWDAQIFIYNNSNGILNKLPLLGIRFLFSRLSHRKPLGCQPKWSNMLHPLPWDEGGAEPGSVVKCLSCFSRPNRFFRTTRKANHSPTIIKTGVMDRVLMC